MPGTAGSPASDLDPAGRWRVNVHVDRETFDALTGAEAAPATADVIQPHPVYGRAGWIAIVNPGRATADTVLRLLHDAHEAARVRFERRHDA